MLPGLPGPCAANAGRVPHPLCAAFSAPLHSPCREQLSVSLKLCMGHHRLSPKHSQAAEPAGALLVTAFCVSLHEFEFFNGGLACWGVQQLGYGHCCMQQWTSQNLML